MNVVDWLARNGERAGRSGTAEKIPCAADGRSYIYLALPFRGVFCWANDVYCREIPSDYEGTFHGMSFNFCIDGGCEVSLVNGNYVYVRGGILSIDTSASKTAHLYPSSRYRGLEIILDFDELDREESNRQPLRLIGFDPRAFLDGLSEKSVNGSFLTIPAEDWRRKATFLAGHLIAQDLPLEDIRFYLMELLFLIAKERPSLQATEIGVLSRGQREIAAAVGDRIASDLARHYTVEDFAREFRISPSSLKKYFSRLYGMPFSVYLHRLRMEEGARLLEEGALYVGQVAECVGYRNQSKFGMAFKEHFGKSPLEHKRLSAVK